MLTKPRRNNLASFLGALLLLGGCGDVDHPAAVCAEANVINGECAGVPAGGVCESAAVTQGIACAKTINVTKKDEMTNALSAASPGTCIVLTQGAYDDVSLPGGAHLLGCSASTVSITGLTLQTGEGTVVRGISVGTNGIHVEGATKAVLSSLRIANSVLVGINVGTGSSVEIENVEVHHAGRQGILLADGADVKITRTIVDGCEGPGIWSACSGECNACSARPKLDVSSSILRDNRIAGIGLATTDATITGVDILGTRVGGSAWFTFKGGGGVSIAYCSNATARGLRVEQSDWFGILVDGSSATLGEGGLGVTIADNRLGLWVQGIGDGQSVRLEDAEVRGNRGVGVGVSGQTREFIVCRSRILDTHLHSEPTLVGGMPDVKEVGDGLVWSEFSNVLLRDNVVLGGNERLDMLVDGDIPTSAQAVDIRSADASKSMNVIHQQIAGESPITVTAGNVEVKSSKTAMFPVATAPASLSPVLPP